MQVPLQIAFRNLPHSKTITSSIESQAERLESFYDRIIACRVVVDMPHRHHECGNLYQVRIDLTVPGREIVVNRESCQQSQFRDLDAAVTQAFDAAERQLEDFICQRRVKQRKREELDFVPSDLRSGTSDDQWPESSDE